LSIILCKVLKHNGVCVINVNKLFGDDMLQMPESYYSVQTSMLLCLTGPWTGSNAWCEAVQRLCWSKGNQKTRGKWNYIVISVYLCPTYVCHSLSCDFRESYFYTVFSALHWFFCVWIYHWSNLADDNVFQFTLASSQTIRRQRDN